MQKIVVIEINQDVCEKLISAYSKIQKENNGEYILFFGQNDELTLTVYRGKKEGKFKAVFVGNSSLKEAKKFDPTAKIVDVRQSKAPSKACWNVLDTQIGSDEVGTGDFFGPICVCAAYVKKEDIATLKALGVDDSKRLTDAQIKELGKVLINTFEYSQVSLDNEKYNELSAKGMNMTEMKAKLHNQVLLNLKRKHKEVKNVLIDQFVGEKTYYEYLFGEKEIVENITFKTKGESYFPSVAVGSIIARYSFLQKMDAISKKYGLEIPFGASEKVTNFAKNFIKKFGITELNKIVKKNFANYKELTK